MQIKADYARLLAKPLADGEASAPQPIQGDVKSVRPGQYVAICAVPKGTSPGTQGTGPPHFTLGMKQEFSAG